MKKPPPQASAKGAEPSARRRILLVDDHPFMRAGLRQLIDRQTDLVVSGEAGNPAEAFAELAKNKPQLVLTDLTMPGRSGLEFIKDMRAQDPSLPILVVSMHDESVYAERVLRAGARGYIMKEAGGENLLAAIRQVLQGVVYVSARMSATILESMTGTGAKKGSSPIEKLTDREFEIFQLVGQGKTTREIADQLHLSPKTVDVHRINMREKLDLRDATALVRYAVRWIESKT